LKTLFSSFVDDEPDAVVVVLDLLDLELR